MPKPRKTPQQKKAISYARDRRDTYGENNKSSRKNVPRHKARTNREYRHRISQSLVTVNSKPDETDHDVIENQVHDIHRKPFKKSPGDTLGEVVTRKHSRR